jgi:hypothetical protein
MFYEKEAKCFRVLEEWSGATLLPILPVKGTEHFRGLKNETFETF